jgi:hypothetical protein
VVEVQYITRLACSFPGEKTTTGKRRAKGYGPEEKKRGGLRSWRGGLLRAEVEMGHKERGQREREATTQGVRGFV